MFNGFTVTIGFVREECCMTALKMLSCNWLQAGPTLTVCVRDGSLLYSESLLYRLRVAARTSMVYSAEVRLVSKTCEREREKSDDWFYC